MLTDRQRSISSLLWVDCIGGLLVGVLVLLGSGWLPEWYGLDLRLVLFVGLANVLYGCFSFSLAVRDKRSLTLIKILAIANIAWTPLCLIVLAIHWNRVSALGIAHLFGEAVYVGSLGLIEWICRHRLVNTGPS